MRRTLLIALARLLPLGLLIDVAKATAPPDFITLNPHPPTQTSAPLSQQANQTMLSVPGGLYTIGNNSGPAGQLPAHEISLEPFRIDLTETTNAAFAEFLNALPIKPSATFAAGEAAEQHFASRRDANLLLENGTGDDVYPIIALDDAEAQIGFDGRRFKPTPGYENHPVTETTWAGASAYCRWRGGRLPTEAQWEAAARGFDGRPYPWGAQPPTPERVFTSGRTGETAAVGSRPAGASWVGALDMSGSLAEWTHSLKRPYPYDSSDGREAPDTPGERVTRGGDYVFDTRAEQLTATHRDGFSNAPERGHRHIGFRCAALD